MAQHDEIKEGFLFHSVIVHNVYSDELWRFVRSTAHRSAVERMHLGVGAVDPRAGVLVPALSALRKELSR